MIKNILWALPIILIMTACHDKETNDDITPSPSASSCYTLSSTTNGSKDFDAIYDNSNRLDSLVDLANSPNVQFKLKYNSNNHLIKSIWYYGGINGAYVNSHYNTNGLRDKDTLYVINPSGPPAFIADSVIIYTYNTSNQISKIDNYNISSNPSHTFTTYSYDASGNLTSETSGGITITYTYDNKKSSQGLVVSFLDPVYGGQQHNIITQTQTGDTPANNQGNSYAATYTYNSNGYALTETDTYQDGVTVDNISYTYNCK